ncbi:MAG: YciI family protein [Alphaproteobacteria bacterium]
MQFVIIARDGTDDGALERRMAARDTHLQNIETYKEHMITAAATLNDAGEMNGSVVIVDFPSRVELDAWLQDEPYVKQGVWVDINVQPCKVAPSLMK